MKLSYFVELLKLLPSLLNYKGERTECFSYKIGKERRPFFAR